MALVIQNLYKSFDGFMALDRINLTIEEGEFVCLLGPSGCGKTTLLRIIAGLLGSDGGKISLDGQNLVEVPAKARGFGIVFQSYSLFPHLTIAQNIGYGLKIRGVAEREIQQRVEELLAMVHLADLGQRYPNQLSGGQQQRVAIAGPWPSILRYCCSTSRCRHWMRESAPICAASCVKYSSNWAFPP